MKRIDPIDRCWNAWLALSETDRAEFDVRTTWYAKGRRSLTEPKPAAEKRTVGRPKGSGGGRGTVDPLPKSVQESLASNNAALAIGDKHQ